MPHGRVYVDFTDHPRLKRVVFAAVLNLVLAMLVIAASAGSPGPFAEGYIKISLFFFIVTAIYAGIVARRR